MNIRQRALVPTLLCLTLLASCSSENSGDKARASFQAVTDELVGTQSVCKDGPEGGPYAPPTLSEGERAKAEWDIAAAENINNVSPQQEWEIRASLGAQMGLAPSQVNGWRAIYQGRAATARRMIEAAKQPTDEEVAAYKAQSQKRACASLPAVQRRVEDASITLAQYERTEGRQNTFYLIVFIVVMGGIGLLLKRIIDANKRRVAEQEVLNQIALDAQLSMVEVYRNRLSKKEWAHLVEVHASRDQARLQRLVDRIVCHKGV